MRDLDAVPTYAELGALVGVTRQAVAHLVASGVITREMTAREALLAYCGRLREQAAGRASAGDLDLAQERAALAKAHRERVERRNAAERGELVSVELLEAVLARAGARVAAILDAVPGNLRRRSSALSAADISLVADAIARARNIAAGVRLDDLADDHAEDHDHDA